MRIVITGCNGFIGRKLTKILHDGGHKVLGIDVHPTGYDGLTDYRRFTLYTISNWKPEAVVHLAAISDLAACQRDPEEAARINTGEVSRLLSLAHGMKPSPLVILAGSGEEYGCGAPDEDAKLAPMNLYAATKAAASMLAAGYARAFNLPVRIMRMATVYGPGQEGKFIPATIRKMLNEEPVELHANGLATRDWLHIDDAVRGIAAVLERGENGAVYNLGGGELATVGAVAQVICDRLQQHTGKDVRHLIHYVDGGMLSQPVKMRFEATARALNWAPRTTLTEGVETVVKHILETAA